ncbi:MAG: T9SS type A sorting domain-containing protein, partial [candidate division Zixibacteria bacterium]
SYAGAGTQVSVVNISNSGATMTADIAVGSPQGILGDEALLPDNVRLLGNMPNPFNPVTIINLEVVVEAPVKLEIYNLNGQRISVLRDEIMGPGNYNIAWDGKDLRASNTSSGVYFCRMTSDGRSETIKMLKLK